MPPVFAALVQELLDTGLQVRFRAGGRSMAPAVRDGDLLTVAPVDPAQVAIGDVILFDGWRGPLAHRVVALERRGSQRRFVMRGDRSLQADGAIGKGQVRGRLVAVERDGRIDRATFAGGAWKRRLARAHARCARAFVQAGQSARAAFALLRSAQPAR